MKITLLSLAALAALSSTSFATVTLSFNNPFLGGVSSNLANAAGTVSNGLSYGVIIDTSGNGFLSSYGEIVLGTDSSLTTTLGAATDDLLYFAADLTSDTSGFLEGDIMTPGGNGGVLGVAAIPFGGTTGLGDAFILVWFDSASQAGSLTDATFTIGADGFSQDYDAPFVGIDPIREADQNYSGLSAIGTGSGITFVPEPSTALLGALGALALLRRRRN